MIYADTNVLLSLVCPDTLTEAVLEWYQRCDAPVALSAWSVMEFRANIGLRVRKGFLSRSAGLVALRRFDATIRVNMHLVAPAAEHFDLANQWLANPDCALRSGDALHLAIAAGSRCGQMVTFDRTFRSAAKKLKLAIDLLEP